MCLQGKIANLLFPGQLEISIANTWYNIFEVAVLEICLD